MKIHIAHLEPVDGEQRMIHAITREALDRQIASFVRKELAGFDRYRPGMTDAQAIELFQSAAEGSYYTSEIDVDITRTHFDEMQCETAQIVWEVLLDIRKDETPLDFAWHRHGTYQMRSFARSIALQIEEEWNATKEDLRDGIVFDWELVPAVLDKVDWSGSGWSLDKGIVEAFVMNMYAEMTDGPQST